jgi:hypothetical protein
VFLGRVYVISPHQPFFFPAARRPPLVATYSRPLSRRGSTGMIAETIGRGDRGSPASLPGARPRRNSVDSGNGGQTSRPLLLLAPSTLHIVAIPLIILSLLATGFILVFLKDILVPLVVAVLIVYLLRPLVNILTRPFAECCHASLLDDGHGYVGWIGLLVVAVTGLGCGDACGWCAKADR